MSEIENIDNDRNGAVVMVGEDGKSCKTYSHEGWRCSLAPGHKGRHVALCDEDDDGTCLQVMSTW